MKKIVRMFKARKAKAMKNPCLIVTLGKGNWVIYTLILFTKEEF